MMLQVFAPLRVLNAGRLRQLSNVKQARLPAAQKFFVLEPGGFYEFRRVKNPFSDKGWNEDWYVLKRTLRGLPCSEFEKRAAYPDDCCLRVRCLDDPAFGLSLAAESQPAPVP